MPELLLVHSCRAVGTPAPCRLRSTPAALIVAMTVPVLAGGTVGTPIPIRRGSAEFALSVVVGVLVLLGWTVSTTRAVRA